MNFCISISGMCLLVAALSLMYWVSQPPILVSTRQSQPIQTKKPPFYVLDPTQYRSYFPDEASFQDAVSVAPFLDLPVHDKIDEGSAKTPFHDIQVAYYYRIRSYRKHIVKTQTQTATAKHGDVQRSSYWVVTEFLPKVPWAGAGNTISAAAGHHILEGRWFWDAPIFLQDYIRFWYLGSNAGGSKDAPPSAKDNTINKAHHTESQNQKKLQGNPQPHIALYTNWIYHAAWQFGLLWDVQNDNHNRTELLATFQDTFDNAAQVFQERYVEKYLTNSTRNADQWNTSNRVCWRQDDGYDAMEDSVSGGGCRPTIASVMWGEAMALVHVGTLLKKDTKIIQTFLEWAKLSRDVVIHQHWNPSIECFAVIPPPKASSTSTALSPKEVFLQVPNQNNSSVEHRLPRGCNLQNIRVPNQPVNVRELLAFMPWYYSSLLPLDTDPQATKWARQFRFLLPSSGDDGFAGTFGLRTVQRSTPCYNYTFDHGDCWDGPSWPYETSRVLTGLANLLVDDFGHESRGAIVSASGMTPEYFQQLFQQYALQHTITRAVNDTAHPLYSGHVFENVHPDEGYWNNRERMYWRNDANKNMGDDYNHSTFLDLVFSSWLGIRMVSTNDISTINNGGASNPWLVVHPLIQAPYFCADRIPYRGRVLSIVFDPEGTHYSIAGSVDSMKGLMILIDGQVVAQRPDLGRLLVPLEPPSIISGWGGTMA